MRVLLNIIGAIALIVGVVYLFTAATFATGLNLTSASAVQITQVYTQAGYNALMGIGALLVALIFVMSGKKTESTVVYQQPQQPTMGARAGQPKDHLSELGI